MPLITTTITPFTHTPSRQNPATFSEDMDYRLSEENSRITQMNNLGSQMNSVADLINDNIANIDLVADDIANVNIVAENIGSITSKIGTADIHNSTSKTTPSDSDEMALLDSTSSFSLKKLTWANLKATLGAIFAPLASPTFTGDVTLSGTGNRIRGDFSNATAANRVAFQSSVTNGNTSLSVYPNGTSQVAIFNCYSTPDPTNSSGAQFGIVGGESFRINSYAMGTGIYLPIIFSTGGAEAMRIDTNRNVLVTGAGGLGYGTGSGGTVTQLTSKGTAVTLNKPSGKIIMNNSSLAAGANVSFYLSNSLVTSNDNIEITIDNYSVGAEKYIIRKSIENGKVYINIKNDTATPFSDAIVLNFAIIKGATS